MTTSAITPVERKVVSKTAQVLKYFAQQYRTPKSRGGIPRKRLMKMAYLSDLLAREHLGEPLTDFAYYKYHFGPYDQHIKEVIAELVAAGLAEERIVLEDEFTTKLLVDAGVPISFDFGLAEMEILRYVASNYLAMPMNELLEDVVYPSSPYAQTDQFGAVLPMDSVDRRVAVTLPFGLEDTLLAEMEIDAGKFTTDFAAT